MFDPGAEQLPSILPDPEQTKTESVDWLRWFELGLVIVLCFGQSFFTSLYHLFVGWGAATPSGPLWLKWTPGIVHEGAGLLLLAYVLRRRNLTFRDLGLGWSWREVGMGLAVLAASIISYVLGNLMLHAMHVSYFPTAAHHPPIRQIFGAAGWFALPFFLINPFYEEVIVRAFLMKELRELTRSQAIPVVVSLVIQTSYHLYYGWEGAGAIGFLFLVYALFYAKWKRILPVIVAHELFDLIGFVRLL